LSAVADQKLKRIVMLSIMAVAWIGSGIGWVSMEARGLGSPVLRAVFGLNMLAHPVLFALQWTQRWSQRAIDLACLLFAAAVCAFCMAVRLHLPEIGASIDLRPLYLWIPVIYVFAFTVTDARSGLRIALAMLALFTVISLPYLARGLDQPDANFTVQLLAMSVVMIAALHFFASYQQRFHAAQLSAEALARLANTDVLTQIANRRRMLEGMEAELQRHARYGHAFSVMLIDVDHFKKINDMHGHKAGDQTLVALAARIGEVLRDVDMLGRWGGEEFVVVLPETAHDETLRKAEALCAHVAGRPLLAGRTVTISCGVAAVQPDDTTDTLLQRADVALYAAKTEGRNRAAGQDARSRAEAPGPASPLFDLDADDVAGAST